MRMLPSHELAYKYDMTVYGLHALPVTWEAVLE
jgi:hypothetical protein